jgi:hypothetical protein
MESDNWLKFLLCNQAKKRIGQLEIADATYD